MKPNLKFKIIALVIVSNLSVQYLHPISTTAKGNNRSTGSKSKSSESKYDVRTNPQEILTPQELIAKHRIESENSSAYQIDGLSRKTTKPVAENRSESVDFKENAKPVEQVLPTEQVTPAALLQSILKDAVQNLKINPIPGNNLASKAFFILDNSESSYNNPRNRKLFHDAKILLIRAYPEVIPGLNKKLSYMPDRFISYFQESLPSFTTAAGKQRFAQAVMMDILKTVLTRENTYNTAFGMYGRDTKTGQPSHEFNTTTFLAEKKNEGSHDSIVSSEWGTQGSNDYIQLQQKQIEQLNNILSNYADQLNINTTQAQFIRWWQNVTIEIALIPFTTTGIAVEGYNRANAVISRSNKRADAYRNNRNTGRDLLGLDNFGFKKQKETENITESTGDITIES
ncbi:hypothetical protein KBC04_03650 [Candidatus Babeliales bacterium]|nr:hypothetical protein [Candidatus Babeliales bacterium]MBP9843853.1 hypothetical protein [Candidatus Babeliales bacterium]